MAFGSIWKFGADNSEYKQAVRQMPSEMDKSAAQIEARTKQMGAKMSGAMREIQGILAGGMALAGLKSIMNDFDQVAKVATRFGASAEEIQRVSVAADLAGTSIDTVARVLTKMSVAASDATTGNKAMAEAFARAGINAEQFKNAGLDEQLVMLSEAFNQARGSADATNQIIELMGTRAAGQMIPLIDNTAALRSEMEAVAVASDDTVRRIEAANDRITRLVNSVKVFFAGAIGFFTDANERIGSAIGSNGLLKVVDAFANLGRGNIRPLFEILGTFQTIKEMDEIQLRANAIAQLTSEGLLKGDDAEKTRLINERMEQIRSKLTDQKRIIEDINVDVDQTVKNEERKSQEIERQNRLLEQQQERRQQAIRSIEDEIRLIEAKISGNKELEESLMQQADFNRALKQTDNFETAANFAETKAAERRFNQERNATAPSAAPGGSGGFDAPQQRAMTALERLRAAAQNDPMARAEEMRIGARLQSESARVSENEARGRFATAARLEFQARQQAEKSAARFQQLRALTDRFFGEDAPLKNLGEIEQKWQQMTPLSERRGKEFEDAIKEMAPTETERKEKDAADKQAAATASGRAAGTADKGLATEGTLKQILNKIQERPILVA